jgi:hypothetical protein
VLTAIEKQPSAWEHPPIARVLQPSACEHSPIAFASQFIASAEEHKLFPVS